MTSRRRFLRDSSFFAVALLPASVLAGRIGARTTSLDQLRFGAFAAHAGSTFWVLQDRGPAIGLELAQATLQPPVNPSQATAPDAWNEKFSLVFRGLTNQALDADTHLFEHDRLGRFEMFITPIGCQMPSASSTRLSSIARRGGPLESEKKVPCRSPTPFWGDAPPSSEPANQNH
jgi:hypothetical protein